MNTPKNLFPCIISAIMVLAAPHTALCKERHTAPLSVDKVAAFLAGRYENSAQVAQGKATRQTPPPQHVTIAIEPTPQADWELWRIHMDVDPVVAREAGSDTSLDAVWAMNIARNARDQSIRLIPYTLNPSVDAETVKASSFDKTQWFSLEACMLAGQFGNSQIIAQVPPNEMCVAETMGIGGKRAFLPTWIQREGNDLQVQLIYFGKPWRVHAVRVSLPSSTNH